MKSLLTNIVWFYLQTLGMFEKKENTIESLMADANIIAIYQRWLEEWVRLFEDCGYLTRTSEKIIIVNPLKLNATQLWNDWEKSKAHWLASDSLKAQMVLLDKVLRELPDILTGAKTATEIMFPNSSLELLEAVYKNNPMADYFNQVLADKVIDYVRLRLKHEKNPAIRIIEVGAGTGATTALVLKKLGPYQEAISEYCYTDISHAFLNHAEKSYGGDNPFLRYSILNIENEVDKQSIDIGSYDITIAANVLHATKNIRLTMRHVKSLLKRNGLVFMNEISLNSIFNHMTFGLLEGWWLFEDPEIRIPGCPGLYAQEWRHVLGNEGFQAIAFPINPNQQLEQQIIIAESDGVIRLAQEKQDTGKAADSTTTRVERNQQQGSDKIETLLIEQLSSSLRIDKHKIEVDEAFSSYGLDSILAVSITKLINDRLGIELEMTAMFEYGSIGQLSDFIILEFQDNLTDILASPATADTPAINLQINELTPANIQITDEPSVATPSSNKDLIDTDDIAIIGIDGKFPGAKNVAQFWDNIIQGKTSITSIPEQRKDWEPYRNVALNEVFNVDSIKAGFLDHIHKFDPLFFGIAPTEAQQMTPEQRLMLMSVWNAIEDAGYTPKTLAKESTGVFIATGPSEYHTQLREEATDSPGLLSAPTLAMMSNRISYHFNFQGPSEFFDTTCSSSLTALNRAVRSLQDGECQHAIVGGINLIMSPMGFINMNAAGMLSKNNYAKPFQQNSDGTVRGEGVGAILIKPLKNALEDNDFIYAVVKGTGIAHGGKGVSITAPNIRGMKAAIQQAYKHARIDPYSISYIEAHGMSASLADNAEIAALKSSFDRGSENTNPPDKPDVVYISTLKPCIGHTEIVSGMAALFKVIMSMQHKVIPAIAHFDKIDESISLGSSPLKMATANIDWQKKADANKHSLPRRASINSFGIGGINAHIIIEESPVNEHPVTGADNPASEIILLSAKDKSQLQLRAENLLTFLTSNPNTAFNDMADTLQSGRIHMESRLAIVATSNSHLIQQLEYFIADKTNLTSQCFYGDINESSNTAASILSGDIGETILKALVDNQNLNTIADYWTKGINIDWSLLHQGKKYRKIPLPGYPFKQISCWVDHSIKSVPLKSETETVDFILNSILDEMGVSKADVDLTRPLHDYGLNSLLLVKIQAKLKEKYPTFRMDWLLPGDSIETVLMHLKGLDINSASTAQVQYPELIPLNAVTQGRPIFWVHGALGGVESFQVLAKHIDRPFYGIQARGFMSNHEPIEGIEAIAQYYLAIIKSVQPSGPYDLGGYCLGGILAYEITKKLQQQGETIHSLIMVDSPDNTGFSQAAKSSNIPFKSAALQVANSLLWPNRVIDTNQIIEKMIHQKDVDENLDDEEFIYQLAQLAVNRGLPMKPGAIVDFIKQNLKVQMAYRLIDYVIQPLPEPDKVKCLYFRNSDGKFFGILAEYFQTTSTLFVMDHVNYWQDWQHFIPALTMVDIKASSHMTMMYEGTSTALIADYCEQLYSSYAVEI